MKLEEGKEVAAGRGKAALQRIVVGAQLAGNGMAEQHVDSEVIESVEGVTPGNVMLGNHVQFGPVSMIAVWLELMAEAVAGTLALFADDCHWCTLEVTGRWEGEHSNWVVLHVHNMFTITHEEMYTQTY